jgi:hypothetical protein
MANVIFSDITGLAPKSLLKNQLALDFFICKWLHAVMQAECERIF